MAKAKTTTRGKGRTVTGHTTPAVPSIIQMLDKAADLGRGIKALENAADGAFLDHAGSSAINWMLEHLEREHGELVAMLEAARVANGGPAHV